MQCQSTLQNHAAYKYTTTTTLFYGQYTGQPALELDDSVRAKFYCPHALADGNQRIRITEKTLEFSSTVLSTLSPYHTSLQIH